MPLGRAKNRRDNSEAIQGGLRVENRMDTVTSSTLRTCSTVAAVGVASGLLVGIFFERWRRTYTDEPPLLIAQAREPLGTNM